MMARPLDQHGTRDPLAKAEVLGSCYQHDFYSDSDVVLHSERRVSVERAAPRSSRSVPLWIALLSDQLTRHRWTRTQGPSSAPRGSAGGGEEECKRPCELITYILRKVCQPSCAFRTTHRPTQTQKRCGPSILPPSPAGLPAVSRTACWKNSYRVEPRLGLAN